MKLNIRNKLFAAFGTVLILLGVVGFVGWRSIRSLSAEFKSLYSDNLQGTVYLANAESALWQLRYGFPQFMVLGPDEQAKIVAEQAQWYQQIDENLTAYAAGVRTPEELKAFQEWEDVYTQYVQARPRWFELYGAGKIEEAAEWRAQTTTPYGRGAVAAMGKLIELQRQVASEKELEVLTTVTTLIWTLIGVTILALVVGLVTAFFLARSIANAARQMAYVAGGISQGELDRPITVTSQDEMGDLAIAFRRMITYIQEMAEVAGRLAEGDVTITVRPKSDRDVLGQAFQQMIANLRSLLGQVVNTANTVSIASGQLATTAEQAGQASQQVSATIQQMAQGTTQQTQAVTETTGNVEQLARAADGIARGAQDQAGGMQKTSTLISEVAVIVEQVGQVAHSVNEANGRVTQAARHGVTAVGQTSQGMDTIRLRTLAAADKVKEMSARSKEIGRIVETIDDIADKTDMLALNAAVEAARAGEHGRGFAVVADQVRKLSEDSKIATRDISELIERVQEAVRETITAMENTMTEVGAGTRLAGDTARSLEEILQAAEGAAVLAERIGRAVEQLRQKNEGVVTAMEAVSAVVEENTAVAEEMAASTREVMGAMEGVASVAEENSASAEEVSASAEEMTAQVEEVVASAQELSLLAEQLQLAVAQFRVEEAAPVQQHDRAVRSPQMAHNGQRHQAKSAVSSHQGNGRNN